MTLLSIGIAVFLGIHLLPTVGGWREKLIGRLGLNGYKVLFSLLSIASFALLVYGFARAPLIQVWSPPSWTRWVAIVLMLPAFIFLVAAYAPGQIKARLKHPFLVAIKTWALAHLIANGDTSNRVAKDSTEESSAWAERIAASGIRSSAANTLASRSTRKSISAQSGCCQASWITAPALLASHTVNARMPYASARRAKSGPLSGVPL